METFTRIARVTGVLIIGLIVASNASAQDEQEYEPDLEPGLHLHANTSTGSVLAEAARTGGSVIISEDSMEDEYVPTAPHVRVYTVRNGDTFWDICTRYFGDPYEWPRIWSYNTQITNPNWIYPGDVIWMAKPIVPEVAIAGESTPKPEQPPAAVSQLPSALTLRNRGFVDQETLEKSGTLTGAAKEVQLLAQFDEAYVDFGDNKDVRPGDKFTAFAILRPVESVEDPGTEMGKLVEILGHVTVTTYNPDTQIARVVIDESFHTIERGTIIGPLERSFNVIPAVSNDRDVIGSLIAILDPTNLSGTHQIVFVDKGQKHGVREGNRFFAVVKRDGYRKSWEEDDDHEGYPKEVIAEIRVVEARPMTSTCLITSSIRELHVGQKVEMRQGY